MLASTPLFAPDATTVSASPAYRPQAVARSFHVYGQTTAGAGAATVAVEVSNVSPPSTVDGDWINAGTVTLTLGTVRTSDGFGTVYPWTFVRARVTAISGTGAGVNVRVGE